MHPSSESAMPFILLPLIRGSDFLTQTLKQRHHLQLLHTPHPSTFFLSACHSSLPFHTPSHFSLNCDKRAQCQGLGENPTKRKPAPSWSRAFISSAEPRITTLNPGSGTKDNAEAAIKRLQGQAGNEHEQSWSEGLDWKWWKPRHTEESMAF